VRMFWLALFVSFVLLSTASAQTVCDTDEDCKLCAANADKEDVCYDSKCTCATKACYDDCSTKECVNPYAKCINDCLPKGQKPTSVQCKTDDDCKAVKCDAPMIPGCMLDPGNTCACFYSACVDLCVSTYSDCTTACAKRCDAGPP